MAWAKLSDDILDNPKIARAGVLGFALYVASITWCARNLTDGVIPLARIGALHPDMTSAFDVAEKLVKLGLWEEVREDNELVAFRIHDFLVFNPTREKVLAERERGRGRAKASYNARAHAQGQEPTLFGDPSPEDSAKNRDSSRGPVPVPVPVPEALSPAEHTRAREGPSVTERVRASPGLAVVATPLRTRPLHVRRLEETSVVAAFEAGVIDVTGGSRYVVPRDELAALDDALDAFAPTLEQTDARDGWLRMAAAEYRRAIRGREQFHKGGGPRGFLAWLNSERPTASTLAEPPSRPRIARSARLVQPLGTAANAPWMREDASDDFPEAAEASQ